MAETLDTGVKIASIASAFIALAGLLVAIAAMQQKPRSETPKRDQKPEQSSTKVNRITSTDARSHSRLRQATGSLLLVGAGVNVASAALFPIVGWWLALVDTFVVAILITMGALWLFSDIDLSWPKPNAEEPSLWRRRIHIVGLWASVPVAVVGAWNTLFYIWVAAKLLLIAVDNPP